MMQAGRQNGAAAKSISIGALGKMLLTFVLVNILLHTADCKRYELRLRGGSATSNSYSGRVEVRRAGGGWGTVCDDFFDNKDASVICFFLGYKSGMAKRGSFFGRGSGHIYMDDLRCTGNEPSLFACQYKGWGKHNCNHNEDAGVICTGKASTKSHCRWFYTSWTVSVGKKLEHLASHRPACGGSRVLDAFRVQRSGKNLRYAYHCCRLYH